MIKESALKPKGATSVELAIAIPLLLFLTLAIIDFGIFFGAHTLVSQAGEQALNQIISDPKILDITPENRLRLETDANDTATHFLSGTFVKTGNSGIVRLESSIKEDGTEQYFQIKWPLIPQGTTETPFEIFRRIPITIESRIKLTGVIFHSLNLFDRGTALQIPVRVVGFFEGGTPPPLPIIEQPCAIIPSKDDPRPPCVEYCTSQGKNCKDLGHHQKGFGCVVTGGECTECPENSAYQDDGSGSCICLIKCNQESNWGEPDANCTKCECNEIFGTECPHHATTGRFNSCRLVQKTQNCSCSYEVNPEQPEEGKYTVWDSFLNESRILIGSERCSVCTKDAKGIVDCICKPELRTACQKRRESGESAFFFESWCQCYPCPGTVSVVDGVEQCKCGSTNTEPDGTPCPLGAVPTWWYHGPDNQGQACTCWCPTHNGTVLNQDKTECVCKQPTFTRSLDDKGIAVCRCEPEESCAAGLAPTGVGEDKPCSCSSCAVGYVQNGDTCVINRCFENCPAMRPKATYTDPISGITSISDCDCGIQG